MTPRTRTTHRTALLGALDATGIFRALAPGVALRDEAAVRRAITDAEATTARANAAADLRASRLTLGMTQATLADALGVARNTVARWERGEMRMARPAWVRLVMRGLALPVAPAGRARTTRRARG